MELTKNEKNVLKNLLDDGRASDMDIAKKLNISSQAVGKIRKKLEMAGIIQGYEARLDYERLGVNTFCITKLRPLPSLFAKMSIKEFCKKLTSSPYIIQAFCLSTNELVIVGAFRDQKELDVYSREGLRIYGEHVTPIDTFVFSNYGVLKKSDKDLFKFVIDSLSRTKQTYPLHDAETGFLV